MRQYTPTDRFGELDHISLDETFGVLRVYCDNLLPDMEACLVFLRRILGDERASAHPETRQWATILMRKAAALGPFHAQTLDLAHKLTGDPALDARLERLRYFDLEADLSDFRSVMNDPGLAERKRARLMDVLQRMPGHVLAASQLLQLDWYEGVRRGNWLDGFTPPKFFQDEWKARLFLHAAGMGDDERALPLWADVAKMPISEIQLNLAAELMVRTGQTEQGLTLYAKSLEIDPLQTPVRLRMAELESPFRADPTLVDGSDAAICLYSWNKADDLKRTLESLSRTDIGPAVIRVLLNGCTDHSQAVAESARALFPNNDFDVVSLPVNIGAPAARNWLGALPEVRGREFVAYLDDDVELPADWLAHFLTVMDRRPDTSAVGCKAAFGSNPDMLQYLYCSLMLATERFIKLTHPTQIGLYDIGQYDFVRTADHVMGCCHLLRTAHMPDGPQFDLRYSPSQMDDAAHDLELRLRGGEVRYCGLVKCIHHQNTGGGFKRKMTEAQVGQVIGNDMKFWAYYGERLGCIREIMTKF